MRKMGHTKTVVFITFGLIILTAIFFYTVKDKVEAEVAEAYKGVKIEQTWELPGELKEISGIAFLDPNRVACVQDEDGKIYIFNLNTSRIEKAIEFAGSGDYEGITIHENIAYVLKGDGTIFKISDFMGGATVEVFPSNFFSSKNDMESLFFDTLENRILTTPKEKDPVSKSDMGIYTIAPATMQVTKDPIYKINFRDTLFDEKRKNNVSQSYFPSEISRDPQTGNFLILEARNPHLLILDGNGEPKTLHRLNPKHFPQPEGITFDTAGNLYISNEGNPATIHRVTIKQ